jgi:hypothetical protein
MTEGFLRRQVVVEHLIKEILEVLVHQHLHLQRLPAALTVVVVAGPHRPPLV